MKEDNTVVFVAAFTMFILIVYSMKESRNSNDPIILKVRQNFTSLDPKYGGIPIVEDGSSYTERKNKIALCIRDKKGKYYDMNTIMYVALHELAHVVTSYRDEKGKARPEHGPEFKKNFSHLLNKAQRLGFYNPNIPMPTDYCGIDEDF